jgi:methionyl aminopeptidase
VEIKTPEQITRMRKACEIASYIREFAGKQVRVGITTDEIDKRVHDEIIRLDVYPSPLGYYGFPKSICTSVNNVICHGIPDLRPLEDGDIINIDVSVYVDGYHGDCSAMFVAGQADESATRLIQATRYVNTPIRP